MSDTARASCVILVSFDADLGLLGAAPDMADREKSLSGARYGATRGLDRVLEVLAEHDVPATWFVPAANLDRYPEQAAAIRAAVRRDGHEIACVGMDLRDLSGRPLTEQLPWMTAGRDRLADWFEVTPIGYRTCGEPHPDLADSLYDKGFRWSSGLRGDDVAYPHPSGLIEIPRHHELDDETYFRFNLDPPVPPGSPRIAPIGDVLDNWTVEFDAYRAEGLCFTLDLHTDLIGTPARATMLGQLLGHIRASGDVRITTAGELAAATPVEHLPADHPLVVFEDARAEALTFGTPS